MNSPAHPERLRCWCGNSTLEDFGVTYARCAECGTLVTRSGLTADEVEVRDDARDFYGREYWISRQRDELGLPDIYGRARLDLPERCVHWLRILLGYTLPPARVLEVGSGHGAFVALLRWAGYEASGLELSSWVVNFARETFAIPVERGRLEACDLPERSLDIIVLSDVLEHLVDPRASMRQCAALLRPGGLIFVQTPRYPNPWTHEELRDAEHPFLAMLQPREHLHLFSERAARRLLAEVGLPAVQFVPALFSYDMSFVASPEELTPTSPEDRETALLRSPASRLVRAMVDLAEQAEALSHRVDAIERDRQQRILMIDRLNAHIEKISLDSEARLATILDQQTNLHQQQASLDRLQRHIEDTNLDYEARLRVILDQQATLDHLQRQAEAVRADHQARVALTVDQQATIERLQREREQAQEEGDSHRRLADERAHTIAHLREQVGAHLRIIAEQQAALNASQAQERRATEAMDRRVQQLENRQEALAHSRLVRLLRYLRLL